MPLQETSGSASYDAFGGGAAARVFIEEVFSTWLYTGNGSTQTITNGIDLSGKGGLVWIKGRTNTEYHQFIDTVRGGTKYLQSGSTAAQLTDTATTFNSNGFTLPGDVGEVNSNAILFASWTFRKQAKFFDTVTYTGDGSNRTISHNLGSVPGCIIVKRTDTTAAWAVYHRSLANTEYMVLNTTAAKATGTTYWNSTTPTSTAFSLGTATDVNASGGTYVAYLFAHDAGGFGLSGTDNVISCGSYTGNGSSTGPVITLGWEPQWVLIKNASDVGNWVMSDNMRNWSVTNAALLYANLSNAEATNTNTKPTATGFQPNDTSSSVNTNGATYIYIAIRRGPMKVPTSGTSVFSPSVYTTAPASPLTVTTNFPVDLSISQDIAGSVSAVIDRLRSVSASSVKYLSTQNTSAEGSTTGISLQNNTAIVDSGFWAGFAYKPVYWNFRRAPGFFDVVCYTGTGVAGLQITHNLAAVPELMLVKRRNGIDSWFVYAAPLGNTKRLFLDSTAAAVTGAEAWNNTTPTATQFTVGNNSEVNGAGSTYVNYLFATVAGVSKVGSYTGTGTTQQINCGFAAGARFVLIKRTNSTGDWYVWDSARGIVASTDPYLVLNSTAAEVTTTDWVDTYSAGFELSSAAGNNVNINAASYIFLSIS